MNSSARSTPDRFPFRVIRGEKTPPNRRKPPRLFLVLIIGIIAFVIINALSYDDVVGKDHEGNPILTPGRKAELLERQEKNEKNAEQYVLRARMAGYRECFLCPESKIWLEVNEIAKIGFSTDGHKRYNQSYYARHDVFYQTEYRGDLTTAKNREILRLGGYPLLPENQKREFKLIYPPLNSQLD